MATVTQHTQRNSRYYQVEGDERVSPESKLVSVTTVLGILNKPWLLPWYKNLVWKLIQELGVDIGEDTWVSLAALEAIVKGADEISRNSAANIGTETHKLIENYLQTGHMPQPELNAPAINAFYAFKSWEAEEKIQLELVEQTVYHPYLLFAGTIDGTGVDREGRLVLFDWKTGNRVYDEYGTQLAGYASAWAECYSYPLEDIRCICVRLGQDGGWETKEVEDVVGESVRFTQLLHIYQARNRKVWK